jgi:hypothetical protein
MFVSFRYSASLEELSLACFPSRGISPGAWLSTLAGYPGLKDIWQHFLVDLSQKTCDRVQEVLSILTIVIR